MLLKPHSRIADVFDGVDIDVFQTSIPLFDPANVNVLNDIARAGIDLDGPARTVRIAPILQHLHGLIGVERSVELLDHLVDRIHTVPPSDRKECWFGILAVFALPSLDK